MPRRGAGEALLKSLHVTARQRSIALLEAAEWLVETGGIKGRARKTLRELTQGFRRWRETLAREGHVPAVKAMLDESGYTEMWQQSEAADAQGRLDNLAELVHALDDFEALPGFLDHVSLVMDNDRGSDDDYVSIMTLHAAKGLEFDHVFLPGWEEGLFPHPKALDAGAIGGLEEERRLAYVGITRARTRVVISHVAQRYQFGERREHRPSRFLGELPEAAIQSVQRLSPTPPQSGRSSRELLALPRHGTVH